MGNEAMVDVAHYLKKIDTKSENRYIFSGNSRLAYTPKELSNIKETKHSARNRKFENLKDTYNDLYKLGVTKLGMSCNNGHDFLRTISTCFPISFIDMTRGSLDRIQEFEKPLLLTSTGTANNSIYSKILKKK